MEKTQRAHNSTVTGAASSTFAIRTIDIDKAFNGKMKNILNGDFVSTAHFKVESIKTRGNIQTVTINTKYEIEERFKDREHKKNSPNQTVINIKNGNIFSGSVFSINPVDLKLPLVVGKKIKSGDTLINPQKIEIISTSAGTYKCIKVQINNSQAKATVWLAEGFKLVKLDAELLGHKIQMVLTK